MPLDPLGFREGLVDFNRRDGSKLELLVTSTWQRRLRTLWDFLTGTVAVVQLNFPITASGAASEVFIAIAGAGFGNLVQVAPMDASLIIGNCFYVGKVVDAGMVAVMFVNFSAFAQNPPADGTFRIKVTEG